jgi:hypothetical protein
LCHSCIANRPVQLGRESNQRNWPASCYQSLGNCMRRGTSSNRRTSVRSGRSQLLWTRANIICARANILLTLRFGQCLDFVDTRILLTPISCRRQYFVDAHILSIPNFCRPTYFVDAYLLLTTHLFCQGLYFAETCVLQ